MNRENNTRIQNVHIEEVDYNNLADVYKKQNIFAHRPGPVYTIPEDESEDDGTATNSDSRLIAKEKKQKSRSARSVADRIIEMYEQDARHPDVPNTKQNAATTKYAIISLTGMQGEQNEYTSIYTLIIQPRQLTRPLYLSSPLHRSIHLLQANQSKNRHSLPVGCLLD